MTSVKGMFSDIPVQYRVVYERERIWKQGMHVELVAPT